MHALLSRRGSDEVSEPMWDTNMAVLALVAGSVVGLFLIHRGFRGFAVSV